MARPAAWFEPHFCAFPMPAPRCREKLLNARVAAMKREAQVAIKGKQKKRALMALKKKKM